jgi:hypothetical protein
VKKSEQLVHDTYSTNSNVWEEAWKMEVTRQLALEAKLCFTSILPVRVEPQIASLGEAAARVGLISEDAAKREIVAKLTCAKGRFRPLLTNAFSTAAVRIPSARQLQPILTSLVGQSLQTVKASKIMISIVETDVYPKLADVLSEKLYDLAQTRSPLDERLVLNYALLVYYLRRWRIPFSALSSSVLSLSQGALELRGNLISIQNRFRAAGNSDDFSLAAVPYTPAAFPTGIQAHSDTLGVVQSESNAIVAHTGFVHRAMPISNPIDNRVLSMSPLATDRLIRDARHLGYPQYEHAALLFMSLTSIEFLLRSSCPRHCAPYEALATVISMHTTLPLPLRAALVSICSSEGLNIRNRCMHGSFLDLEGRREDLVRSSGLLQHLGVAMVDLTSDGSLPERVSAMVLGALNDLSQHLDQSQTTFDTTWTEPYLLTSAELVEANHVYCDFLQDLDTAEGWRLQIRDYLGTVCPCLSQPLQFGIRAWFMNGTPPDTMPGFYFLVLLFEPFARFTLHLAGRPVLQESMTGNASDRTYHVQYQMLDSRGILAPDNIGWFVDHLTAAERPIAERVLVLAMKCRDAFAHGAVSQFTEDIRNTYGHIIVKAIQLVVEAGSRHLQSLSTSDPGCPS